jgi:hypothetical protein
MMVRDRAHAVSLAIMDIVTAARGDAIRQRDVLQQRIKTLLREEFWDERREGVADRGDANA